MSFQKQISLNTKGAVREITPSAGTLSQAARKYRKQWSLTQEA